MLEVVSSTQTSSGLDPGSGVSSLHMIVAFCVGACFAAPVLSRAAKGFLNRRFRHDTSVDKDAMRGS